MKCTECAEARRFSDGAVYCVQYGMIIREKHECRLPGAHEKTADEATSADPPEGGERIQQ